MEFFVCVLAFGVGLGVGYCIGYRNRRHDTRHAVGRRCVVRTYSAGVHIGYVKSADGMECHLTDALRLWRWEGGGLSLSAVANRGIVRGRLNRTGEVYLTNCVEFIPTTQQAENTYAQWIEDDDETP